MNTPPPHTEFSTEDIRLLITTAVMLYDRYGDDHDVLSSSQVWIVERLRPLVDQSSGDTFTSLNPWDVLSIATTAVELTDRHGIDDEELEAAVERARAHVEVDDAES
jgi:hypothetical protein